MQLGHTWNVTADTCRGKAHEAGRRSEDSVKKGPVCVVRIQEQQRGRRLRRRPLTPRLGPSSALWALRGAVLVVVPPRELTRVVGSDLGRNGARMRSSCR